MPGDEGPTLRRVVLLLSSFAAALAVLDLLGWVLHMPALVGVFGPTATMKPNTALCILLIALAVPLKIRPMRRASVANAACVCLLLCAVLLSAATLLEYWTGHPLPIDRSVFGTPADPSGDPAGRMSRGTAIDGLLCGLALLCMDGAPLLGTLLCVGGCLLSLSALIGFLFDAGPLLGVPLLRSMAVQTALGFASLQASYFLVRPEREPVRSLAHSARHHRGGSWFILASCFLPLLLGWPIAALYRQGRVEASFAFALLVVFLIAAQAFLAVGRSQSLAEVESKRELAERQRYLLQQENDRQNDLRRGSDQRAAQSEALYRLITDALPAMVSYLDRNLRYVRVNKAYEDWLGTAAGKFEGKSLEEMLGPSAASVRPHLEAALRGEAQAFETKFQSLQGERILSVSHMPDRDAQGTVRGVVVQAHDITAQKTAEQALRQTEKLAAVGKLASSIAHEINNPLESVTNLLYLAKTITTESEVRQYLVTAEEELRRVSVIASQTLRFHRQSTRPRPVRTPEMFDSLLAIYGSRLHGGIRLEQRHRQAPPVTCMDGEIRQVLNNLVGNALDAMTGTTGRLLLRSQPSRSAQTGLPGVVMTVADTGDGMDAKTMDAIFDAFFTTKGMAGTGLGLWVSKEIVDRHAGTLRVRSSQGKHRHGTVFRLFLPFASPMVSGEEVCSTSEEADG